MSFIQNEVHKTQDLIFIGYGAYGDYLSYNGMIRYFLKYYNKIYYHYGDNINHKIYLSILYNDIPNRVIFINTKDIQQIINHLNILNAQQHGEDLLKNDNNKHQYFNGINKITKLLNIEESEPNYTLSNSTMFYYKVGINPDFINNLFYFKRNYDIENIYYEKVLQGNNISKDEKYILVSIMNDTKMNGMYIQNKNLKIINICYLVDIPLFIIKLLENAEEIHVVEHSNALMMYYLQVSNNFNYNKTVYMHYYARDRGKFLIDMYKYPKLSNWIFIE
jgi:hypothetical protein